MFSNLKGSTRGFYHRLRKKYLKAYLDEFIFHVNRRRTPRAASLTGHFPDLALQSGNLVIPPVALSILHGRPSSNRRAGSEAS